nr:MAG TPA: hypothetical protein [Caudoviricetes sp.]
MQFILLKNFNIIFIENKKGEMIYGNCYYFITVITFNGVN